MGREPAGASELAPSTTTAQWSAACNIRDHHMTETLDRLMQHHGTGARALVWAHNTHIGDARFTDMVEGGMVNLGQLVRPQTPSCWSRGSRPPLC